MAHGANDAAPSVRAAWIDGWCRGLALPEPAGMGMGMSKGPAGAPRSWGLRVGVRLPASPPSSAMAARSSNVTVNDIYHEVIKIYFQRPLGNGPRKTRQQTEAGGRQRGGGTGREMAVINCGAGVGFAGEPALPFPTPVNRCPGTVGRMLGHPGAPASWDAASRPRREDQSDARVEANGMGGAFACRSCVPGCSRSDTSRDRLKRCWARAGWGWDAELVGFPSMLTAVGMTPPAGRLCWVTHCPCIPGGGHCRSCSPPQLGAA